MEPLPSSTPPPISRRIGLFLGPAIFLLVLWASPPEGMSEAAWRVAAAGLWMAVWWVTEAIPIPATALLPLALFPLLRIAPPDANPIAKAAAPYANPIIFLFLGGFLLAMALEQSGLHRRLALNVIRVAGVRPANLVGGFMIATAFISMWVSNTATVAMMLPIALSVIHLAQQKAAHGAARDLHLPAALLLGLAYAASIGGVATLIGTPPNALLAAFMLEAYDVRIGFGQWMLFGVPVTLMSLPICWALLTRVFHPLRGGEIAGGAEMIRQELRALGPLSRAERTVGAVALLVALSWIFRPLLTDSAQALAERELVAQEAAQVVSALSDEGIAIIGALLLFIIPVNWRRGEFALDWRQSERLPWGVLLLFGGGLSLADAIQSTGLAAWIGGSLSALSALPLFLVAIVVTAVILFLTELTSNTATAAAFLPVVASLGVGMGADPLALAVPAAVAATCAFMMPVGTPPNALVYSSGRVSITQMMWAGFWLNLILVATINLAMLLLGEMVFGSLSGK